jgi:succinoglycan biosynthesis protein ExoV
LNEIRQSGVVLAEAMHAAITADALRVPWIPVRGYPRILSFKWQDWCLSVGLDYQPHSLPSLYSKASVGEKLTRTCQWGAANRVLAPGFKLAKAGACALVKQWNRPRQARAVAALKQIAASGLPMLSADRKIEELTGRLQEKLEDFKQDYAAGTLFPGV